MTTYRDKPSVQWTDMSAAEFTAQYAPWSAGWIATLHRNQRYLKELMYGTGSYVGDVPHSHLGNEDAHPAPPDTYNILMGASPNADTLGEGLWPTQGFYDPASGGVLQGGISGDVTEQVLWFAASEYADNVTGTGLDVVFSLHAKSVFGGVTTGVLVMGLSVGESDLNFGRRSTSVSVEGAGGLQAGTRGLIHATDITTSWKRFYLRIDSIESGRRQDMRFSVQVLQDFDNDIRVSGFMANPGRRLYPWSISPADDPRADWSHGLWNNLDTSIPLLDWDVGITNAVELKVF